MTAMSYTAFIKTLPPYLVAALPNGFTRLHAQQPFRWIIQFYDNDRRIHYEVSRVSRQHSLELGLHFESKDRALNQFYLQGFQRHLLEIQHEIGAGVEAEQWDRGWAKVYELLPEQPLTAAFQKATAQRLADLIVCCHPILHELSAAYHRSTRRR